MKELYLEPQMDLVEFRINDVIATSYAHWGDLAATNISESGKGGPNEGEVGDEWL